MRTASNPFAGHERPVELGSIEIPGGAGAGRRQHIFNGSTDVDKEPLGDIVTANIRIVLHLLEDVRTSGGMNDKFHPVFSPDAFLARSSAASTFSSLQNASVTA